MVLIRVALILAAAGVLAACGSGSSSGTTTAPKPAATTAPKATGTQTSASSPSALQAEAKSAASGDIPDNQVFIVFRNAARGYALKYPEGWAEQGNGATVTFRDKNNIVRIVVNPGAAFTTASVRRDLASLKNAHVQSGPMQLTIGRGPAFKVVYATESAANAVTGKRVKLVVDRYYLSHGGKEAIVDLGTPQGVDNVDAYRLMIESFRWR
jgi:hypothetical protein